MLSFSCHVLSFNPTGLLTVTCGSNVQAPLGRSIFSLAKSCDVTSSHLSRARVSSTAARVFESCCPERRNEQGHASSTAVRATGMQRGVANAGSTAERSSSLLLSATLPKCRRRNPACACLHMVSGNVTSTGTLRNSRLMLSSSRYGGQKSGCRKPPQPQGFELVW